MTDIFEQLSVINKQMADMEAEYRSYYSEY